MISNSSKSVRSSVVLPEDGRARIGALAAANDLSAARVIRHQSSTSSKSMATKPEARYAPQHAERR